MPSVIRGGDNFDSQEAVSGTAKAWVNFNGAGTVAIRAGYNVSSITDTAVGRYDVNFTTDMPDTNYAFAGAAGNLSTTTVGRSVNNDGALTTTSASIRVCDTSTTYDDAYVGVVFFGN